ncbi:MAG: hypothetical protein IH911_00280 [Proteobacteria bacterium]|nr:hypothetical protein [Pseudomonadota bacterium]
MLAGPAVMALNFFVTKHLTGPKLRGRGDNDLHYHYSQHLNLGAGN